MRTDRAFRQVAVLRPQLIQDIIDRERASRPRADAFDRLQDLLPGRTARHAIARNTNAEDSGLGSTRPSLMCTSAGDRSKSFIVKTVGETCDIDAEPVSRGPSRK